MIFHLALRQSIGGFVRSVVMNGSPRQITERMEKKCAAARNVGIKSQAQKVMVYSKSNYHIQDLMESRNGLILL